MDRGAWLGGGQAFEVTVGGCTSVATNQLCIAEAVQCHHDLEVCVTDTGDVERPAKKLSSMSELAELDLGFSEAPERLGETSWFAEILFNGDRLCQQRACAGWPAANNVRETKPPQEV